MTASLVGSSLLFLADDGSYELEGELEQLQLPTSLRESIRLRLSTVKEQDATLLMLLQAREPFIHSRSVFSVPEGSYDDESPV